MPFDPKDFDLLISANEGNVRRLVDKIFASVDQDGNQNWSFDEVRDMLRLMAYRVLG